MRFSKSVSAITATVIFSFSCAAFPVDGIALQSQIVTAPVPNSVTAEQTAKNLLESGWEKNQANRGLTLQQIPDYQANEDVLLAFTLNRMQHRRYRDALNTATQLTTRSPDILEGWILRIWLETLSDNYERALTAMRSFKTELDNADKLDDQTKNEMIKHLGRLFGFMQGPVESEVNINFLNTTMVAVTDGFDQDQMQIFNESREGILKKYEDLTQTHDQKISDERDKVTKVNAVETQNISNQNALIEERANDLEPKIAELEEEAYQRLDQVKSEIDTLRRDAALLNSQLNSSLYTLNTMYDDLYFYRQYRGHRPNLVYIPPYIQNQQYAVDSLRGQLRSLNNQVYAAESRANQIRNDYQARISSLTKQLERMGYTRRKNDRKLVKLAKGPQVASGKIGALSNRASALKTYDPFPLELARQQLLDNLK